ncbi:hypothetical protein K435DRAFT_694254 [Dendrothele bispora CBS 962.96]|uniref:Uncharacterized protein n=1 Tax=Dendrothele bispora (strain CBS 962.96) TaxID=1314807 RepID=A0A4S8KYP7_DENBC|nr:hypothetical protein K435DRAFT_694254 [Dendrothele bispora CBS 962.96]
MVDDYESGASEFNPYASPEMKAEERQINESVDDDDYDDDQDLPVLETSPGEFLYYALEIEQQQCVALQLAYMPVALQIIATLPPSQTQVNAKDLPLYLPSMLDSEQRSSDLCKACLPEMEIRLCDGQLTESLNHLRQALLVKQRLLRYKKTNARNQGATTRSRAMINRQEKKVKLAAKAYQEAWKAKLALVGGDRGRVGFKELLQEHIICMEDLQDAEKKRVKAMKHKRKEAAMRALDGDNPVQGAREKHRVPSWIWHFSTEGELSQDKVLYDGLRIEWCKSYARVKRWREEVLLLQEEMRRCVVTLKWQAQQWEGRADIDTYEGERWEGSAAYAYEQANVRLRISARFEELWSSTVVESARKFQPGDLELESGVPEMEVDEVQEIVGNDEEESDSEADDEEDIPGQWEMEGDEGDEDEEYYEEPSGGDDEETMDGDEEMIEDEEELLEEQSVGYTIKNMLSQMEEDFHD